MVTTHKIDLFTRLQGHVRLHRPLGRAVRGGLLFVQARRPVPGSCQRPHILGSLPRRVREQGYWASGGAEALLFGAGGSNLAISLHLMTGRPSGRPATADRRGQPQPGPARVDARRARAGWAPGVKVEYVHNADPLENDRLLGTVPPGSLVVNGTGMGKDSPGSPITDKGVFPERPWSGSSTTAGSSSSCTRRSARN